MSSTVRTRPTAIDLYAGAGGLSLGMEQAGFDVLVAAELDPIHAQVHRFNFPATAVLCRDLSTTTASDLLELASAGWSAHNPDLPFPGRVDAVVGGPPCQGFSVGGIRNSDDDRNDQLLTFARLVCALRPQVFCLENVAGLLEGRFDSVRKSVLDVFNKAGYSLTGEAKWVDAQEFGVPQARKRLLIMGSQGQARIPDLKQVELRPKVGDALEGLPDVTAYRALLRTDEVPLRANLAPARSLGEYAATLAGLITDPDDYSYPRGWDPSTATNSRRTVHTVKSVQRFARTLPGRVEPKSRLFRLDPRAVAHTLRAGTGPERGSHTSPRPIHPTKNRVVTVREAARLHGFPDWFRFHTTNWHGHRQVGNSVPPPLARAAGAALLEALGQSPIRPTRVLALGDPEWLKQTRRKAIESLDWNESPRTGPR